MHANPVESKHEMIYFLQCIHTFRDGDDIRVEIVQHVVGQREVAQGLGVNRRPEIAIVVTWQLTKGARVKNHRSDTIESRCE